MKRPVLRLTTALVLLLLATALIPLEGRWVDLGFSRFMSAFLALRVEATRVRITGWRRASFGALQVSGKGGDQIFDCSSGDLFFPQTLFLPLRTDARLEGLRFSVAAVPALPVLGQSGMGQGPYFANLRLTRAKGLSCLRLIEFHGGDLSLRGGLMFRDSKLEKAHLCVTLSGAWLEALPKAVSRRLLPDKNGGRSARLVFVKHFLTLTGSRAPLFSAEWS